MIEMALVEKATAIRNILKADYRRQAIYLYENTRYSSAEMSKILADKLSAESITTIQQAQIRIVDLMQDILTGLKH